MLLVTPLGLKFAPLNDRLQPLKRLGKSSATARNQSHHAIDEALQEFTICYRTPPV